MSETYSVADLFSRESTDESSAVAQGFGLAIQVRYGHLVIRDGIGSHRRERRYAKADRTLQRVIILSTDGYVSLESLAWCAEHNITMAMVSPDAELLAHHVTSESNDPKLLRRQVMAADTDTGVEIARELLTRKVSGQADVLLKSFSDFSTSARLYQYVRRMRESNTITQHHRDTASLSELEGWAARDYFSTWIGKVAVPFDHKSTERIPANWTYYPGRSSVITGGGKKYNASDPVNAILNLAYTFGYNEARTACVAHGLNPMLGFIHSDKAGRDSLALDILEVIRPEIDLYVLGLLGIGQEPRAFSYRDFCEPYGYEPGTVRLVAPLTHEIAEASYQWRTSANDAVKAIVNILTGHQGKRGSAMPNWTVQKLSFTTQNIKPADVLSDSDWRRFANLLPSRPARNRGQVGHPPIDNRVILAAIIHCDRHHRPWAHVPESFGISYRTMTERRRQWQRSGHWDSIAEAVADLAAVTRRAKASEDDQGS